AEGVHREVAQQRSRIAQAGERQADQVRGAFSAAHQQVEQTISAAHSQLESQTEAAIASLAQWHASAVNRAADTFSQGSNRALGMGETYGAQAIQAADDEANKFAGEFSSRIAQARRIGEEKAHAGGSKPEIVEAKAKAARDLAADTEE